MKESIWTDRHSLSKEGLLASCPKCQKSKLTLTEYHEQITAKGQEFEQHGYPHGIEHLFNGFMKCNNCNQILTIVGTVDKDIVDFGQDLRGEYYENYYDQYTPKNFDPNIRYFKVTSEIPKEIIKVIDLAFHHYFNDLNASANKIRIVIELILNDIKAPKKRWSYNKSKFVEFKHNLHDRIEHFGKQNKYISRLMLANKFIGNDGSHPGNVKKEEVLDAFDNLEEILDKLYIKKQKALISKANRYIENRKKS